MRAWLLLALLIGLFFLTAGPAQAARPITRGFTDDVWFTSGPQWVQRTTSTGARLVLLEADWLGMEPTAPTGAASPDDPSGPEYYFNGLDAKVKEFQNSGLTVALLVTDAPAWAEAPGGPASLEAAGAWKPDPTAFGQLATALARRYSGTYPDPADPGHALPRVRFFQAWGEANFTVHLAPQWVRSGRTVAPFAPGWYRLMLNAFYAGIKSVHSNNVVITTGLGPYGDPSGVCPASNTGSGCRTPPAEFLRTLLCLNGHALRPLPCPDPAHYDALAIDPYEVGSPTTRAYNADDVTAPDLGKLTRTQNAALRSGRALPRAHKQLWVTEFSYDSNPPNPGGESLATQARWLAQSLYVFWTEGVDVDIWYLVRDQTAGYNPLWYYSGVYFYSGRRKPAFEAYRFPLVVMASGRRQNVWGISPRSGSVVVQRQVGRRWSTLFTTSARAGGVFVRRVPSSLRGNFRAKAGSETSLVWHR